MSVARKTTGDNYNECSTAKLGQPTLQARVGRT